jgi:hypothetical protein
MTRKHFSAMAKAIAKAPITNEARKALARELAAICATTNPNFDRARFLAACGVTL